MQAEYFQRGTAVDIKNTGSGAINPNGVVALGGVRIGVAGCEIPVGRVGSCHVTGVFIFETDPTAAFTVGQSVFWDGDTQLITSADTGIRAGWVTEQTKGDGYVKVKID